jgi:hypothetical protein
LSGKGSLFYKKRLPGVATSQLRRNPENIFVLLPKFLEINKIAKNFSSELLTRLAFFNENFCIISPIIHLRTNAHP